VVLEYLLPTVTETGASHGIPTESLARRERTRRDQLADAEPSMLAHNLDVLLRCPRE
jgi:hypothetical protein